MTVPQAKLPLSIVVAAWNGPSMLKQCLDSLKSQSEAAGAEIVVASNFEVGETGRQFPHIKHLALSAAATVPELRTAGLNCARGEIVALLEDNCLVDQGWCEAVQQAHLQPHSIIGGAVENVGNDAALDWAVYFYDYGKYMNPNQAGIVSTLSGNNVSYKRPALASVNDAYQNGFFETFVHEELKKRGYCLWLAPSAIVYHQKRYEARHALAQCFHHARSFAGKRIAEAPLAKRLFFVAGSLLLPVLLPARIAASVIRKGRHNKELLMSFPHLMLLMSSWSLGEFCGYLCGEGSSARMWR
jgi:GT2 family glycosyltransferase